jgi:hypothetical protein
MDPGNEQKLKEEVVYLHSLWHQGPPRTNPIIPNPNIDTTPTPKRRVTTYLRPAASRFKKQGISNHNDSIKPPPSPALFPPPAFKQPSVEWPCPPPPEPKPETYSAWPVLNLPAAKKTRVASAQEQARYVAEKVQRKALKLAKDFFGNNGGSDDDDDSEDDEDDAMEEEEDSEEYSLLMRIFIQDRGFRGYYEKNYGNGEFCCLVCHGIGQKIGKRYKDCVALVQHCTSIAKTKKKMAHRAFGRAICKVLDWDIKKLPSITSSLTKPEDPQGNVNGGNKEYSNNVIDSVNLSEKAVDELMVCENPQTEVDKNLSELGVALANDGYGESMIYESCLTEVYAVKNMEKPVQEVLITVGQNADVVVNHLQSVEDDADGIKDDVDADVEATNK